MAYNNLDKQAEYPESSSSQAPGDYGWKPNPPIHNSSQSVDPEDLTVKNFSFSDETIRKAFIRKVYLIVMSQLLVTFGFVALFVLCHPVQNFTARNPSLLAIAFLITIAIVFSMSCCEAPRRQYPTNMICLGIFTVAESFLVGCIAGRYHSETVLLAVGITAVLCLTLTIFAIQTKYDFTMCGGFLVIAAMLIIIFGLVTLLWHDHMLRTVYAGCGALLACIFLIYDTQLMMGGNHKYTLSPEEYIFAALNLYMDVILIFLYILQLLGGRK